MKYLSDYTQQGITDLLNQYGGFFAFSTEQFNEQRKEGVIYTNCSSGLICPKENATALIDGLVANAERAIKQDIEENGKEKIIERELHNHEAFYNYDRDDTVDSLSGYHFTREEIYAVFLKLRDTVEVN